MTDARYARATDAIGSSRGPARANSRAALPGGGPRHDAHPLVQFLDGPSGRRTALVGRGLDVWEVIATVRDNSGSIAQAAAYLQVPAGLVDAAVAYYGEYRGEIDVEIQLNETEYERGRAAPAVGERALGT